MHKKTYLSFLDSCVKLNEEIKRPQRAPAVSRNSSHERAGKSIAPQMPETVLPTINWLASLEMRSEFLLAPHSSPLRNRRRELFGRITAASIARRVDDSARSSTTARSQAPPAF